MPMDAQGQEAGGRHQAEPLAVTQGTFAESSICPLFSFSPDSRYNPR